MYLGRNVYLFKHGICTQTKKNHLARLVTITSALSWVQNACKNNPISDHKLFLIALYKSLHKKLLKAHFNKKNNFLNSYEHITTNPYFS